MILITWKISDSQEFRKVKHHLRIYKHRHNMGVGVPRPTAKYTALEELFVTSAAYTKGQCISAALSSSGLERIGVNNDNFDSRDNRN